VLYQTSYMLSVGTKRLARYSIIVQLVADITVGKAGLTSPRRLPDDLHIPNSFLNQVIEGPRRPEKSSLTLEDYRTLRDKLNSASALSPNDAKNTKDDVRNI